MFKLHLLLIAAIFIHGCGLIPRLDTVVPDKRTEYRKSQALPDLEVPPDLTAETINDSMAIPGEQAPTRSQYERQQAAPVATPAAAAPGEQSISVRGSPFQIWERLRTYFHERGYALELDDAELGVLETEWSEPRNEDGSVYRHKFKIFSEPGGTPDVKVLFISGVRQEQVRSEDGSVAWVEREGSEFGEKQLAGDLNLYFAGRPVAGAAAPAAQMEGESGRSRAELVSAEDGKVILAMPEEFSSAWVLTGTALERAGFAVGARDQARGIYEITYYDEASEKEKAGFLSKLAFWKDDEEKGYVYRISLTGVGDQTELIVLNEKGDWEGNVQAGRILAIIQNQYNTR